MTSESNESNNKLKQIVEAALIAAGEPLSLDRLMNLFLEDEEPERQDLRDAIEQLQAEYEGRGIELVEVGGGFRINVRKAFSPWISRLWEERPARYSRALLETLGLIAYRQPITRGEIEEIRGVSVSTHMIKTLVEREWVRVVGQRDVPGKPSLYATTREFLNYFSLKGLGELPTLQEIRDFDTINRELDLQLDFQGPDETNPQPAEAEIASSPEAGESDEVQPVSEAENSESGPADAGFDSDPDSVFDEDENVGKERAVEVKRDE
ncbi:MAG: SMC-Scp complex subunit ScpB [Gammaproteobacteria bacterium]|nr:SMC-Scp complex subunit ScpB [Gammaproteobacteria bacterium]